MPEVLTVENLKPLLAEMEQRISEKDAQLHKEFPRVNDVMTPAQVKELFAQEKSDLRKDLEGMIPKGMREAITDAIGPKTVAAKKASDALRFALTHTTAEVKKSKELTDQANEFGLGFTDEHRQKALGTSVGASMGFLVPEEARGPIIELERKFSVMQAICPVMDNPPPKWSQPREKGGVTFHWNQENTAVTGSTPTLENVVFSLTDVNANVPISNALLQWAFLDVTSYVSRLFARDLAVELDGTFVAGDGSAEPLGILNATGVGSATQAAAAFDWPDFNTLWHTLNANLRRRAVWMAHDTVVAGVENIKDNTGMPAFFDLSDPSVRGIGGLNTDDPQIQGIIKRRPLYDGGASFTSTIMALFVPEFYQIAMGAVEIASSEEYAFTSNQTTIRMICHVDGKETNPESVALMTVTL